MVGASATVIAAGTIDPTLAKQLNATKTSAFDTDEALTPKSDVTSYNNFYEFGFGKSDPKNNSGNFRPLPWQLHIEGLVNKPLIIDYDKIIATIPLEERIYRMRCVEAWSMVIPWIGFPLKTLLNMADPMSSAKYVAFESVLRPDEMPEQKNNYSSIEWPYREGLRIDEAMNPLTIIAVGLYGETLENQNGAPMRLVVPWKYGFKGIKSISRIILMDKQPQTTWQQLQAQEYGFYANVNPAVPHPRWSQASERRIGGGSFFNADRRETLLFNGYAEEVAHLYSGMDLKKFY